MEGQMKGGRILPAEVKPMNVTTSRIICGLEPEPHYSAVAPVEVLS